MKSLEITKILDPLYNQFPEDSDEVKALAMAEAARGFYLAPESIEHLRREWREWPANEELPWIVTHTLSLFEKTVAFRYSAEIEPLKPEVGLESTGEMVFEDLPQVTSILTRLSENYPNDSDEGRAFAASQEAISACQTPELSEAFRRYLHWCNTVTEEELGL